jgi:hypothetical protein
MVPITRTIVLNVSNVFPQSEKTFHNATRPMQFAAAGNPVNYRFSTFHYRNSPRIFEIVCNGLQLSIDAVECANTRRILGFSAFLYPNF